MSYQGSTILEKIRNRLKELDNPFDFVSRAKEKVSKFFEPTEDVRTRDVIREIPSSLKKISEKVFGSEEDLKSAYEKAKPILPSISKNQENNNNWSSRLTNYGVVTKQGDKYFSVDPLAAVGSMKNVVKQGLDSVGNQLLKNIKNTNLEKVAEKTKSFPKIFTDTTKKVLNKIKATDVIKEEPTLNLKKYVNITDIYGKKSVLPEGEALTPYQLKGNKVLLQDGEPYVVSKNQYQNIKGNSIKGEAKEFAPELKGVEEIVKIEKPTVNLQNKKVELELKSAQARDKGNIELADKLLNDSQNVEILFGKTKYSQYQLPNGKNYKEILIKAPSKANKMTWQETRNRRSLTSYKFKPYNELTDIEKKRFSEIYGDEETFKKRDSGYYTKEEGDFKSSHWDEPNVISHLRMNDRTYKGKKVSFMEELQSDWAREVRKKETVTELALEGIPFGGIPNNPLLKNWQKTTTKRALQEAVNNNADYFAWINGKQTSARYNLSKQINYAKWDKSETINNAKRVTLELKDGGYWHLDFNKKGVIENVAGKAEARHTMGKKLDEVLGKGLADKIMEKESGTLKGEGLSFGGEWAENLYDRQVKNIVEDLTGGKAEKINMRLPIEGKTSTRWFDNKAPDLHQITNKDLKIGKEIRGDSGDYIITDVLENGKFKAVEKSFYDNMKGRWKDVEGDKNWMSRLDTGKETFDISTSKTTQQAIKLTPEIKAKIRGEAPALKKSSGSYEFGKASIGSITGVGATTGLLATSIANKNKEENYQELPNTYAERISSIQMPTITKTEITPKEDNTYKEFKATYYNPTDPNQTKSTNIGIGAFNKPVKFGDVAMGLRKYEQGTLLEIPKLKDVKTPYGNGVFRVNDKKNIRYNKGNESFDIAIPNDYPKAKELQERIGNNTFTFKIIK